MKTSNQKGFASGEVLFVLFIITAIIISHFVLMYYKDEFNKKYAKEIAEQNELIAKHHKSKIGHFIISSYEECMNKNSKMTAPNVTKSECIQIAINNTNLLSDNEKEEGLRHLREYIFEADEFNKKTNKNSSR